MNRVLYVLARELLPFVPAWALTLVLAPGPIEHIALNLLSYVIYFIVHGRAFFGRWFRSPAGLVYGLMFFLFSAAHLVSPDQVRLSDPFAGFDPLVYALVILLSAWAMAFALVRRGPLRAGDSLAGRMARQAGRGLALLMILDCLFLTGLIGIAAFADWLCDHERLIRLAADATFLLGAWALRLARSSTASSQESPA